MRRPQPWRSLGRYPPGPPTLDPDPVARGREEELVMTVRWRIVVGPVPAMVLLVLGAAGCGGGSTDQSRPDILGKAFHVRATAVCQSALAQKRAQGPFPYPDFNPTRPDLSKLPSIARLEAKTVLIYKAWIRQMVDLG